ncbi:MAG: hypothetical protein LBJ35_02695, partial [Spirochaetaceae bacterium]|nr:hypothetical protein [Spirochaetaceae bacterium]
AGSANASAYAGSGYAGGLFVLAVPFTNINKRAVNPNGISWGQEFAIELMDMLLAEPPAFDTLIYFAGDNWPSEPSSAAYPYAGLQALFNQIEDREDVVLVYCDFPAPPDAVQIVKGRGQTAAPLSLVESFFRICARREIPCFFNVIDAVAGDFMPAGDIPVLRANGDSPALFNVLQSGKKILASTAASLFYEYAGVVMRNRGIGADFDAVENDDRNYAYIGFKRENIFISEYTLVLLTLFVSVIVVFLCLFLFYTAKSRVKRLLISILALILFLSLLSFVILRINTAEKARKNTKKPQLITETAAAMQYFTAEMELTRFLGSNIVKLNINSPRQASLTQARLPLQARLQQPPLFFRIFFTRDDAESSDYFIYDTLMPYNTLGRRTEFILGSYPPASLSIEIGMSQNITGEFVIEALFEDGVTVVQNLPYTGYVSRNASR